MHFRQASVVIASKAQQLLKFAHRHLEIILIFCLVLVAAVQYYVRPQSQNLEQIRSSKQLRVLIADEPDSQYIFNNQHFGFEYEFLEAFAKHLEVELVLDVVPYGELFTLLSNGQADIAVGGILDSPFVDRVSTPSDVWYEAKTTVIYKRGSKRIRTMEDLIGLPVLTSTRYFEIEQLQELNLVNDHRSEYDLMSAVNRGEEGYVLSTDYRGLKVKHYMPNLVRSFLLPDSVGLIWVMPKRADQALLNELNTFIAKAKIDRIPEQLAQEYFSRPPRLPIFDAIAVHRNIETRLPALEFAFRKASRRGDFDWHLLAAIAYQESRWSNDAVSPTGVRGLMQITNKTAEQLGLNDRLDMAQSIEAAARYLQTLKQRLPQEIKEPQRTWFAVAAYNVGFKHVMAAYRKTQANGDDPNLWENNVKILPELYGEPFPKGVQAQTYVKRVKIFTDIVRFYDLHLRSTSSPLDEGVVAKKEQQ